MKPSVWKDFKVHAILITLAAFIICKFSTAPILCPSLSFLFARPAENTISYELLRITENLSLAYIAALIFYILVDYIPCKKAEGQTAAILEKPLSNLYLYMDKVLSYYKFAFDISDFSGANTDKIKEIDNFSFPITPEFLFVESTQNHVSTGGHVEWFDAQKEIVMAGTGIASALEEIDSILAGNRMPVEFISLMNRLRSSGFLEKLLKIMPGKPIIVSGTPVAWTYLTFYKDLCEFEAIELEINWYDFPKRGYVIRKATQKEIVDWVKYQKEVREKHPEIDEILKQLPQK